jgi:hypothetical protein
MCHGFIYDVLTCHLNVDNLLYEYIHIPSLVRSAEEITVCFNRAISFFDNDPEFFICTNKGYEYVTFETDINIRNTIQDEILWNKFTALYPGGSEEIHFAIQIGVDNNVARNTILCEEIIKRLFMNKLRILLVNIPDIHRGHTNVSKLTEPKSPGPASYTKISNLRYSLGLPVSKWEREEQERLGIANIYN